MILYRYLFLLVVFSLAGLVHAQPNRNKIENISYVDLMSDLTDKELTETFLGRAFLYNDYFFKVSFLNNGGLTEEDQAHINKLFKNKPLLVLVFRDEKTENFFSKQEILSNISISYKDINGKLRKISLIDEDTYSDDIKKSIVLIQNMMGVTLGAYGKNLTIIQLDDFNGYLNPYAKGALVINFKESNKKKHQFNINFPLNSLFTPRICPNGKKAHISWNYCPWSGMKLE